MNKYIQKSTKKCKTRDISFHYTCEKMAKELIALLPLKENDSVLDAGSGKNKVWFKNIPKKCISYECEIEDGEDFLTYNKKHNYIIGNPPFHLGWLFLKQASKIAQNGIAFLGNINFFNCLTPKRLEEMKEKNFTITRIHIMSDKRWYGRYYFIIFTKNVGRQNDCFSWNLKSF